MAPSRGRANSSYLHQNRQANGHSWGQRIRPCSRTKESWRDKESPWIGCETAVSAPPRDWSYQNQWHLLSISEHSIPSDHWYWALLPCPPHTLLSRDPMLGWYSLHRFFGWSLQRGRHSGSLPPSDSRCHDTSPLPRCVPPYWHWSNPPHNPCISASAKLKTKSSYCPW